MSPRGPSGPDPLQDTNREHQERLVAHVERLHGLAEMVDAETAFALRAGLDEEWPFIEGGLLPHIEAVESTLYPRLEALMGPRHSMDPMRDEHAEVRRLVATVGDHRRVLGERPLERDEAMALRRALYRLHALMRVHLAEEAMYLRVLDEHLTDEERAVVARGIDHAAEEPL
jgi:hypothetical protein